MTKNPYLNALSASLYIVAVVSAITIGGKFAQKPDTILAPIAMLSTLVFSVAFMAYTFFFNPIMMYLDGQKREAVELFTKTLMTFAAITAIVLFVAFAVQM